MVKKNKFNCGIWQLNHFDEPLSFFLTDMHSKGVILRAFEQFRLKSCINFTPWQHEDQFIHIQKNEG